MSDLTRQELLRIAESIQYLKRQRPLRVKSVLVHQLVDGIRLDVPLTERLGGKFCRSRVTVEGVRAVDDRAAINSVFCRYDLNETEWVEEFWGLVREAGRVLRQQLETVRNCGDLWAMWRRAEFRVGGASGGDEQAWLDFVFELAWGQSAGSSLKAVRFVPWHGCDIQLECCHEAHERGILPEQVSAVPEVIPTWFCVIDDLATASWSAAIILAKWVPPDPEGDDSENYLGCSINGNAFGNGERCVDLSPKQFCFAKSVLDSKANGIKLLDWLTENDPESSDNSVYQLRNSVNKKLKPLGIEIVNYKNGRWGLSKVELKLE